MKNCVLFCIVKQKLQQSASKRLEIVQDIPLPAPLSKSVAPDESIERSTVKVDFFVFIFKNEGWCCMK